MSAIFYSNANAFCFEDAGALYGVSPDLLRAVAMVESSMKPSAMNLGHSKRTQSHDIGLMQINSRWLKSKQFKSLGYVEAHLLDACTNVKVGAWIMAHSFRAHGMNWEAVGAYNAACTSLKGADCTSARNVYAWKVYRAMGKRG